MRFILGNHRAALALGPLAPPVVLWLIRCFLLLLLRCCLLCFTLQLRFQLANLGQPSLAPPQLGRQLIAAPARPVKRVFCIIDSLGLSQQPHYFRLQGLLRCLKVPVAQRFALGRVGFDLRAVNGHMTQLYQARPLAQLQHLHEQLTQLGQVPLAKIGNAVVIGMLIAAQDSERHVIIGGLFQLPRRHPARAVTVNQQLHHQRRVVRRATSTVAFLVLVQDPRKIQRLDHIADVQRQMIVAQPLAQVWRQQQLLIHIISTKRFAHAPQFTYSLIAVYDFFPTDSYAGSDFNLDSTPTACAVGYRSRRPLCGLIERRQIVTEPGAVATGCCHSG